MNVRLKSISPEDLGLFLGAAGFVVAVPFVIFAFAFIGPGRTVTLNGFVGLTFMDQLDPVGLVLAYPILNATIGFVVGLLVAWFYNFIARFRGGIRVRLEQRLSENQNVQNI